MIVKRVKSKMEQKDGEWKPVPGTSATHYVKKLAHGPLGAVAELTPFKAEACEVSPEQFEAVRKYYAEKPLAGEFSPVGAKADAPKG